MYLRKFVTFVSAFILFVFVSFFDSVFIVFNLCRMHCALALNPTSIWQLLHIDSFHLLRLPLATAAASAAVVVVDFSRLS